MTDLVGVMRLVERTQTLELEVATLDEQLKTKKAELRQLLENDLPEAIDPEQLGEGSLLLGDDKVLVFKRNYHIGVTEENKRQLIDFLVQEGLDNTIKREVTITFGKNTNMLATRFRNMISRLLPMANVQIQVPDDEALPNAIKLLCEESFPDAKVDDIATVHHSTLKAIMVKRIQAGKPVPPFVSVYAPLVVSLAAAPAAEEPAKVDALVAEAQATVAEPPAPTPAAEVVPPVVKRSERARTHKKPEAMDHVIKRGTFDDPYQLGT